MTLPVLRTPALLLALAVSLTSCAAAQPCVPAEAAPTGAFAAPYFAELDHYIRGAMADWDVPGLAIAVVSADSVLFARGYGLREAGRTDPVDTRTLFGLMSPTKTFTAAALAMLVEDGALRLDDRLVDHLPAFRVADPALTRELTIRDLLSHRTGYEENHRLWYGRGGTASEVAARAHELERIAPPGTEFHYNNVMYVVAGEVIEAVSGLSWDEFVRQRIFGPLDMTESTTSHRPLAQRANVAAPHARRLFNGVGSPRPIPYFDTENVGPAGSIHTNVAEAASWLQLHLNVGTHAGARLLSAASIRELQQPHVRLPRAADPRIGGDRAWGPLCGVADLDSLGYGLGWFTMQYRGRRALMHGGGINGQRSAVGQLPDQRAGVVILSNMQDTEIALALTYRVFDMLLAVEPRDWNAAYLSAR